MGGFATEAQNAQRREPMGFVLGDLCVSVAITVLSSVGPVDVMAKAA
jgi:hypothetical protein